MATSTQAVMLAVVAASITGAVCWHFAGSKTIPASRGSLPSSTEQELATLKAQVNALQADHARTVVVMQPAAASSAAPSASEAIAEPAPPERPKVPPTRDEARAAAARDFDRYDTHFAAEARDPAWATSTERQLSTVLTGATLASARLESFQCASSMCKLEAHTDNEGDFETFAHTIAEKATAFLPSGRFRQVDDGHGGLKVEGYFMKDGARLPAD